MPELRRIVPMLAVENPQLRLMPEFSGGEGIEALMADGYEGGVAKDLSLPYGEMFACKRLSTFLCVVTAKDTTGKSVVTIADSVSGEPRGRLSLFGNKFDRVRVGSVLKVEAFGKHASGLLREGRCCRDSETSWLISV